MIAFGSSITSPEAYERFAGPGVRLAAEPNSAVLAHAAAGTLFRSYNLILEKAAELLDLEALVLVHQDAEIVDRDLCRKLREVLRDPMVGVVGCVGAAGVRSIAWWEGSVTWGSFVDRYREAEGAGPPALTFNGEDLPSSARRGEVDVVDGFLMALSPWVVRNVRFDESLGPLVHGHDLDLCLQVRAAGRKVIAADLEVVHHHPIVLVTDPESWMEAHMAVAEKWHPEEDDWKSRARRAEAEAGAARLQGASKLLQAYASAEQHQRELAEVTDTLSWRITEPLRRLNAQRRALLRRARARASPAQPRSRPRP
jgi:Glycosyltransferase like family